MKRILLFAFVNSFLMGCNNSVKEQISESQNQIFPETDTNSIIQDTIQSNKSNTNISSVSNEVDNTDKENFIKSRGITHEPISFLRQVEFPGDDKFNGKPIIHQMDLSADILKEFPDTLSKLAVDWYKSFDGYFPKAIADNFEEGVSQEIIVYPDRLTFEFQMFESKYDSVPYLIKKVTVKRNTTGEPFVE